MPFPSALSAGNKTTLRTSGFWQRSFVCFNPGEVVFQCEANETIDSAPFKAFQWTNTLQGSFSNVLQGMVVYISSTTSYLKNFKYRGRVRLAPSASEFRIDLNATLLNDGDIVTVIRDADLFARVREDTLVDGSVTYHNLPPVITGLPSVLCLYDSDADGNVSFAFTQSGIPVSSTATSSFTWLWTISGTGTTSFTVGSSTSQNPTIQFQTGFHYLVRCRVTDSNGIQNFTFVQVYAITRTFAAPVILPVVAGNVSQDLDNGYTGSITAYSGVSTLPYRTHAAVFAVEHFGDNSSTPMVTNILMHGRLRSEDITTEGSAEAGRSMHVTYPLEGITSYMQRMKVPNDIVRHAASPNEWGEMTNPTPFRRAIYFLFAYTTLLNVCSFSAGDSLFDAWHEGGVPISIDGGMALDALKTILDRIKAAPNYAPDGEIRCEITASYKADRSALVTIMDFTLTDVRRFGLNVDSSKQTGQVIGTGGSWNTVNNTFVLFTSAAPTVPYGDNPETRELTRELLQHDNTTAESADELAGRTGNDFAFNNPKKLVSAQLRSAHRWLVATNYQRYTFTLAATDNVPGEALTTATKFQCQRVDITINTDGTYDVSADFPEETTFTDAQSIASQLPNNIEQINPVLPVLSDDPAFPDEPLWSYPTDTPADDELQPIDPYSAYLSYSPFPPNQAAEAAAKQGTVKCKTFQHNMRNGGTTTSPFLTVAAAAYTVKVSGFSSGGEGDVTYQDLLTTALGAMTHLPSVTYPFGLPGNFTGTSAGEYVTTGGFGGGGALHGTVQSGVNFDVTAIIDLLAERDIVEVTWRGKRVGVTAAFEAIGFLDDTGAVITSQDMGTTDPNYGLRTYNTPQTGVRYVCIGVDYNDGDAWLDDIAVTYVSTGGGGDWFYRFDDDNNAVSFDVTHGGFLDGSKPVTIPAYNPAHTYEFPFVGTGFAVNASYVLSSYTSVENKALTIEMCRNP